MHSIKSTKKGRPTPTRPVAPARQRTMGFVGTCPHPGDGGEE